MQGNRIHMTNLDSGETEKAWGDYMNFGYGRVSIFTILVQGTVSIFVILVKGTVSTSQFCYKERTDFYDFGMKDGIDAFSKIGLKLGICVQKIGTR